MGNKPGAKATSVDNEIEQVIPGGSPQEGQDPEGGKPTEVDDQDPDSQELDESEIPEHLKAHFQKLRREAAKYRTKAKNLEGSLTAKEQELGSLKGGLKKSLGVEDEETDPVEQLEHLQAYTAQLEIEKAISDSARLHGIPMELDTYYRFLLSERLEQLEEGEELDETDMEEILSKVRMVNPKGSGGSTGVSTAAPKSKEGAGAMTVEQFNKMSTTEKSQLYSKDPAEYNRLAELARKK